MKLACCCCWALAVCGPTASVFPVVVVDGVAGGGYVACWPLGPCAVAVVLVVVVVVASTVWASLLLALSLLFLAWLGRVAPRLTWPQVVLWWMAWLPLVASWFGSQL